MPFGPSRCCTMHSATFTNVNIHHLFVILFIAHDLMQLAGVWRVKYDSMTPILRAWQSTSQSLCSDSRLAYYSTSIPDWSPSSTINLNWLAVGSDFPTVDGNRWEWGPASCIENQGLAKVVIFVYLTVIEGCITNQMNIFSAFALHYSLFQIVSLKTWK